MGLLEQSQYSYYTNPSDFGNYQFTSLDDIINQFLVAYVGEEKIISKVSRTDVAFHAQRAMQELSFDTFKSIKSQEIVLPPSNTMILPHDYVNYTKLAWSDSAGIKHPLYPTSNTSNPFKIRQNSDNIYDFWGGTVEKTMTNNNFEDHLAIGWTQTNVPGIPVVDNIVTANSKLKFTHGARQFNTGVFSRAYAVWQEVDVTGVNAINLTATGVSAVSSSSVPVKDAGVIRVGIVSSLTVNNWDPGKSSPDAGGYACVGANGNNQNTCEVVNSGTWTFVPDISSKNHLTDIFDLPTEQGTGDLTTGYSYLEFSDGTGVETTKSITDSGENGWIDVSEYNSVYVVITSHVPNFTTITNSSGAGSTTTLESLNTIDTIKLEYEGNTSNLQSGGESTTWSSYKSSTPNENTNPEIYSYDADTYNFNVGERYGLDPQHAQTNGSFYIDNLRGLINFSSNISGKTVILDYISDSLGTDGEMQVHKFAEEAMYRWILHAIAAGRIQTQQLVPRLKKEKIAAIRQAKLRLSNVKLEELTQILRGKSKHIKH